MNIGLLCPAEIAIRRFLPSLAELDCFEFSGVAVNSYSERFGDKKVDLVEADRIIKNGVEKGKKIIEEYGGRLFDSYCSIVESKEIDSMYIPLPPALHFEWAKKSLSNGKHVLLEKPATIHLSETCELIELARKNGLALHENYMFLHHKQIQEIDGIISSGRLGDIRLIKILFGFPFRSSNDFRYNKALGGGALLDAGGYTIKYATHLLGETAKIETAKLNYIDSFEVDFFGSGTLSNSKGTTAQISFGMDNEYKCELEIWGSKGTLNTYRVLTAPVGYRPVCDITVKGEKESFNFSDDNAFKNSISYFYECITDSDKREREYSSILRQAQLVDEFMMMANYETEQNGDFSNE